MRDGRDDDLTVRIEDDLGVPVAVCTGRLTVATSSTLRGVLGKQLLDRGRLLVEVDGLQSTSSAHTAVFSAVLARSGGWPTARMVVVGTGQLLTVMRLAGNEREVPIAADRAAGLGRLDRAPDRVRRTTELPAAVHATRYVRELVRVACSDWDIPDGVRDRAMVVADELVANAVQHTRGPAQLALTVDAQGLRVSVRDGSSNLPPSTPDPMHGLAVVAALSDGQGVSPHLDGKTVWVLLRRPA
ncbi:MAG: hypothetical protein EKK42_00365 [Pseudonocardiaceae bacterium]|nr:MAG: hypothetical protein EKK42_00365 [Pseudonocardiaceae bacterium]